MASLSAIFPEIPDRRQFLTRLGTCQVKDWRRFKIFTLPFHRTIGPHDVKRLPQAPLTEQTGKGQTRSAQSGRQRADQVTQERSGRRSPVLGVTARSS
ncbi:uncharacterized [Tachysurus ichikawai]